MKRLLIASLFLSFALPVAAGDGGGITASLLREISGGYTGSPSDKAIRNAISRTNISVLAATSESLTRLDDHFSDEVKTYGVTDQKSSGRCWLFTGLNVIRAGISNKYGLGTFTLSQNYLFFYDQLEKSNLFLQCVIDTRQLPFSDRNVDWLFSNPLSDGGTFTGVADLACKYGIVPSEVMPETQMANNTAVMRERLRMVLREGGLRMRRSYEQAGTGTLKGKKREKAEADALETLQKIKIATLTDVYRILALCLGVPPAEFSYAMYDKQGKLLSEKTYTPLSFFEEHCDTPLSSGSYVMIMNDPSKEYGKVYEIDKDRHVYDGNNWLFVNLPMERVKEIAVASIKAGVAMYFSSDYGSAKYLDRRGGIASMQAYDWESLLGVKEGMDKAERILTHASASTHALTLIGVDIKAGVPVKWKVENSWGYSPESKGLLYMTDEWFDEYMFRLVAERRFVPADVLKMLDQEPVLLPAWDPLFQEED